MPRKNKTAATVAENREAQRRSRARRQELIADLQGRLEEYERMGVAASIEMQCVARAVNVQNERLKSLLGVYGVSEDEIKQYLSSSEENYGAFTARHRCNTCGRLLLGATQTRAMPTADLSQTSFGSAFTLAGDVVPILASVLPNPTMPTPGPKQPPSTEPLIASILRPREDCEGVFVLQEEEHGSHRQMHAANGLDETAAGSPSAPTDTLSPLSDSSDSSNSVIRHYVHSEPLETSCEKAAEILVEFHNHADPSWARSALGCHGDRSCYVKNTRIFQLMDHLD